MLGSDFITKANTVQELHEQERGLLARMRPKRR